MTRKNTKLIRIDSDLDKVLEKIRAERFVKGLDDRMQPKGRIIKAAFRIEDIDKVLKTRRFRKS